MSSLEMERRPQDRRESSFTGTQFPYISSIPAPPELVKERIRLAQEEKRKLDD